MAVDLAQKAQNFTNRGRQALETGRYELAVDMLMEAVSAAPDVLETRRLLRAAQIANFRKNGKAGFGAKLGYKMAQMKIMGLVKKGRGVEAMAEAEKLLCQNPLDPDNIEAAVKAAEAVARSFAGMSLALDEAGATKLVEELASWRMPYISPGGKPTMIFTSTRELDRKFAKN